MREIKFRAWDKINKSMYQIREIDFLANAEINSIRLVIAVQTSDEDIDFDFPVRRSGEYELMQFTGLKDKNDKEIYEGDILNGLNRIKKIVKWSDSGACFCEEEQFKPVCTWSFDMLFRKHKRAFAENCKLTSHYVIGNIYENPELLTNNN